MVRGEKEMYQHCFYETPVGIIIIEARGEVITGLEMSQENEVKALGINNENNVLREANKQLQEYFRGERKEFNLPLHLNGTEFQQKVWRALQEIPYGETRSYGEIAKAVGSPKGSRAVGGANNKNPVMIFVPCHRVIGANGALVGFGGGLSVKQYLLELEQKYK